MAQSPSPLAVANAFVHMYYNMMHDSPERAHQFYGETSKLGRPEEDGSMSFTTSLEAINHKILSLNYAEFRTAIASVDAQESHSDAVLVVVTGSFVAKKDNQVRDFSQTFVLAPHAKGYFVLNDVFRYIQPMQGVDVPVTQDEVQAAQEVEEVPTPEDEVPVAEEVQKADDVSVTKVEVPVAEEAQKAEDVPKKSFASLVKHLKESGATFSPPPNRKPAVPKNVEKVAPRSDSAVDANGKKGEAAKGYKIYIKDLPMNATESMVEDVFKKFGAIKRNGIQVRSVEATGFCFGFVEFQMPSAVQKAIQASPVQVGERRVFVEEKRSNTSSSRPRFQPNRGTSSSGHQNLSEPPSNRGTSSSGHQNLNKSPSNRRASSSGHHNLNKPSSSRGTSSGDNGRNGAAGGTANGVPRNTPPRLYATAPTTKAVYRIKTAK